MKTLTRQQAIEELRGWFRQFVDDDHSICQVASRFGFYCKGFSQWDDEELKRRYAWIAERRPGISREELERLANAWQVARKQVLCTELACDTQAQEHDTCKGWDEWSNDDLARFYKQLEGEDVQVVAG